MAKRVFPATVQSRMVRKMTKFQMKQISIKAREGKMNTLATAYRQGEAAFYSEKQISDCPFAFGGSWENERIAWRAGFLDTWNKVERRNQQAIEQGF